MHRDRPGDVAVIGGGLAGGLLALALAERGLSVVLISAASLGVPTPLGPAPSLGPATSLSYAGVLGPDLGGWAQLQERHGDLGLRHRRLHPHGQACGQVDLVRFCQALPLALGRLGVRQLQAQVAQSPRRVGGLWQLELLGQADGPPSVQVGQVVLAAGAGCRALWPGLSQTLRSSWAGILHLEAWPDPKRYPSRWLRRARAGGVVLPQAMVRPALEQRAGSLVQEEWVVDPGLAGLGDGLLVGQISLVRPGLELGAPPDLAVMESRLRQALGHFDPVLAELPARYRQVPVSFCSDGKALAGPVAGAPGLWALAGFRGAFGEVPRAAQALADQIASCLASPRERSDPSVG